MKRVEKFWLAFLIWVPTFILIDGVQGFMHWFYYGLAGICFFCFVLCGKEKTQ